MGQLSLHAAATQPATGEFMPHDKPSHLCNQDPTQPSKQISIYKKYYATERLCLVGWKEWGALFWSCSCPSPSPHFPFFANLMLHPRL